MWKRPEKRWTLKAAMNVGNLELNRMTLKERAELAEFFRVAFVRRQRQFLREGRVSYPLARIWEDMGEIGEKLGFDMTPDNQIVSNFGDMRVLSGEYAKLQRPHNQLATYISLMQQFFEGKSSSLAGWKSIAREQDIRLFGGETRTRLDSIGRTITYIVPKHELTDADRINFWKVYSELYKSGWTSITSYSSGDQKEFGRVWMNEIGEKGYDFEYALERMQELMDARPRALKEMTPGESGNPTQPVDVFVDNSEGEFIW